MNTSRIAFLFLAALTFAGCADLDGDRDLASRSGAELCPDLCAAKARSGCAGFSMSACVSECEGAYRTYAACAPQLDVAVRCTATARYTCDAGRPTAHGCGAEGLAFAACLSNMSR